MNNYFKSIQPKILNISNSKKTIYDEIEIGDPDLWLTSSELEEYLSTKLKGHLLNQPIRTRSKIIKTEICKLLGYPIPNRFKKTQPRFPGQNFDIYVQKSNNLQIWNEELDPSRRYILIKTNTDDIIIKVKVVTGSDLAPLDTTGTLTQKYQASYIDSLNQPVILDCSDTLNINSLTKNNLKSIRLGSPTDEPSENSLLSIEDISKRLETIIGQSFPSPGHTQERLRGAILHKLVCLSLGYQSFKDNGKFPDIRNQLLEVKLQTSSTVDLGLVLPNSDIILDLNKINNISILAKDIRYAIFYASLINNNIYIENLVLITGESFFEKYRLFQGKKLNKKIQIPLPKEFI